MRFSIPLSSIAIACYYVGTIKHNISKTETLDIFIITTYHSIIILTGNLGGDLLLETDNVEDVKESIMEIMKKTFKQSG